MKNAYIDNTQIHSNSDDLGFVIKPGILGLEIPQIRLSSINKPSVDGAIVPGHLYGPRLISFDGKVWADDISTYRTRRRTMESAASVKRVDDVSTTRNFKFKTMDDLELQIAVYVKSFSFPDTLLTSGNYRMSLLAPEYRLLSQALKQESTYIFSGGGLEIPLEIPVGFSNGASTISTLVNAGNIDSYPTVTIFGPIINPVILNESNSKQMTVTYTLTTAAQHIVIDTLRGTALYYSAAGVTGVNIRQYISGDFLTLASGSNSVKLTTSSYNSTAYVNFQWRDTYSGV